MSPDGRALIGPCPRAHSGQALPACRLLTPTGITPKSKCASCHMAG